MRMLNLNQIKQLVSREMRVLAVVLVGYGSNDNRLEGMREGGWNDLPHLQYPNCMILSNKESVIVSPVITVHTLRRGRLTQCQSSQDSLAP